MTTNLTNGHLPYEDWLDLSQMLVDFQKTGDYDLALKKWTINNTFTTLDIYYKEEVDYYKNILNKKVLDKINSLPARTKILFKKQIGEEFYKIRKRGISGNKILTGTLETKNNNILLYKALYDLLD